MHKLFGSIIKRLFGFHDGGYVHAPIQETRILRGSLSEDEWRRLVSRTVKGRMKHYVVKDGDTLSGIALSQCGDASVWLEIAEINNIDGPYYIIQPNDVIVIPTKLIKSHRKVVGKREEQKRKYTGKRKLRIKGQNK